MIEDDDDGGGDVDECGYDAEIDADGDGGGADEDIFGCAVDGG